MAEINPGDVLKNRYLVIERVSRPDSPTVSWRGQDTVLGRDVHLEQVSAGNVALAIDGARRASLVNDERLIRIIDISDQENVLIRPWLDAVDLGTVLRLGPLAPATARTITGELATALRSARRRGLHHLALRPEAVMLSADNRVFLSGLSVDSWVFGYDDEDAFSASRKDAVDLVALLYAMLSGQWPQGRTPSRLDPADAGEYGPLSLSEVRPDTPADLVTLCDVTLGKQGDGPITPDDLVQELRPWDDLEIDLGDLLGSAPQADVAVAPISRPTPIKLGKPFSPVGPLSAAASSAQSAPDVAASAQSAADAEDSGPSAAAQVAAKARATAGTVLAAIITGLTALGAAVITGSQKLWAWLKTTAGKARAAWAKSREAAAQRRDAQAAAAQASAAAPIAATPSPEAPAAAVPVSVAPGAEEPRPQEPSAEAVVVPEKTSPVFDEATSVLSLPSADAKRKPRELVRLQHIITGTVILLFAVGVFIGVQHAMEIIRTGGDPGVPSRPTDMPSPSPLPTRPASPSPSPEPSPSPSPTITYPSPVIKDVRLVDTTDPDRDSPQWLGRAWDGDLNTTWNSWWSGSENWNGSRIGMGVLIEFEQESALTEINLIMTALGGHVQLRSLTELGALPPAGEVLAEAEGTGRTTLRPADPIITDRVVLWFDRLPRSADGTYRVELAEIQLF